MKHIVKKKQAQNRRHRRVRAVVEGTRERLRLSVFRSAKQIYAQLIDDQAGRTLLAFSSVKLKPAKSLTKSEAAYQVGEELGRLAVAAGIKKVAFDRGGYLYHGRVKSLADGARHAGLKF